MSDAVAGAKQLQEAFAGSVVEMSPVQGTPRLRVTKEGMGVVAHYLHTHPSLRGTLSLLWAVDLRPREATDVAARPVTG